MKLKWVPKIDFGWYSGNPMRGLVVSFFDPIEDYPSGYWFVGIFGINLLKFEFNIGFEKKYVPRKTD